VPVAVAGNATTQATVIAVTPVHGWFYRLQNGLLKDLRFTVTSLEELEVTHADAVAGVRQRYQPAA
jgi:hypothetical protein